MRLIGDLHHRLVHLFSVVAIVAQIISPGVAFAAPTAPHAPTPETNEGDFSIPPLVLPQGLPSYGIPSRSGGEQPSRTGSPKGMPVPPRESLSTDLLPSWFDTTGAPQPQALAGIQGAAQCPPADDLAIGLTIPPYRVSEGNTAGDVYTVTVSNSGTISATEVSLLVDPNVGFYYVGGSATVSSNLDSPSLTDPGTTAPDAPFSLVLNGSAPLNALEPGETLTFTFKLATTDYAPSSQLLTVSLQSGSPSPATCISTSENVPTGRGNLTLVKGAALQDAAVGDVVTWTIELKNTGLGNVYNAVITDTFGSALTNTQIIPAPAPVDLNVGETFIYTATALVASCGNLTNYVQASWSIGNEDGTATGSNPIDADADIALLLEDPAISVQVGALPEVLYCGTLTATVPVTVTNSGGTAQQLVLDIAATGLVVSNPQPSSEWTLSGNQLTYTGGPTPGMIRGGETVTLTLDVVSSGPVCSGSTASLQVTPRAYDACLLLQTTGTAGSASANLGFDAPTLSLSKDASAGDIAYSGETLVYTVTLAGTNITNTNGITVTDVLTDFLQNVSAGATAGTVTQTGNAITWTLPSTNATVTETLLITATIPDQSPLGCAKGQTLLNEALAVAAVCPECTLSAQASDSLIVLDPLAYGVNNFTMESSPIALCNTDYAAQQFTTTLQVRTGITWTGSIFTDTLGAGVFDGPYSVVPGSLQVLVDGVDRTGILSYTLGPPLVIDFSGMSAISPYSDTADIVIFYQAEAGPSTLVNDPVRTGFVEAYFDVNGPAQACDANTVAVLGTYVTLQRGNLDVGLAPAELNSCQVNNVTISVTGGQPDPALRTDHLVVTFTAQAGDVYTPTAATFTGALAGIPVTITQTGLTTTFEFSPTAAITGDGSIVFPLYRPCGVTGALTSTLTYQDLCGVSRDAGPATAGQTTHSAQVSLYVTPDEYTVYERNASWRWYVSNLGDLDATNAVVTNTLPAGYHFLTYTLSTAYTPSTFLSTITAVTGTVGGREVVTFTIGTLPIGARVRFDAQASIASCVDPAQVDIGLTLPCGLVKDGGALTCSGVVTDRVLFHSGPTALLSSNYQDANIPLCQSGKIRLEVKNASLRSDEFDFVITDTLTNATYINGTAFVTVTNSLDNVVTGDTSGQPLANIPFTPTVTTTAAGQLLTWDIAAYTPGTPQYDVLVRRDGEDLITIEFFVQSDCTSVDAQVQSVVTTRDICDLPLSTTEDSISLLVSTPDLVVDKVAGNLSDATGNTSTAYPDRIYASVGDSVAFTITVSNQGDAAVINLFVTDTLPVNISVTAVSPVGNIGAGTVDWGTGGGITLPVGSSSAFLITGTVTSAACSLDGLNTAQVSYGCSTSDICLSTPVTDTAIVQTVPVIRVQSITGDLLTCGGQITVILQNDGPPAYNVVLTDTLPAPYVYDADVSATTLPSTSPTAGDNPAVWTWSTLPTGQTTLVFRVRTTSTGGTCAAVSSPVTDQLDVAYTDSCNTTPAYTTTATSNIGVGTPALAVSKTPVRQSADVGNVVTWTITVENVGTAIAPNIVVTDTLDSGFSNPSATNGSGGNEATTAIIAGNVITWTPAFTLPVGGVWSAQVSAQLLASGQNTNTVQAVGSCGTGCVYDSQSADAHVTLLAQFDKLPDIQTKTIGAETTFTFTARLSDQDAIYSGLTITDALPVGLGYLSSVVTLTYDLDGNSGGPVTVVQGTPTTGPNVTTPPSAYKSGNIVWNLGDIRGTALITGVVRAVVQDIASNQQGVRLTNRLDMTYVDDGNPYAYHDEVVVDLLEPTLVLAKEVRPEYAEPGTTLLYTLTLYHAATSTLPAYNVRVTDTVPGGLHYVPGSLQIIPGGIGTVDDLGSPQLLASFDVISPTYTVSNPIRLRYAATVDAGATFGTAYTNTARLTWTSLFSDTYNETRDGSGGIDDYLRQANAVVRLNNIRIAKQAPISVTAGNSLVYTVTVFNDGPDPALNTVLTDTMPFQVQTSAATYSVPGGSNGACTITTNVDGDRVVCSLGSIPVGVTATAHITATVPPDVPEGADLTNIVEVTTTTPDGRTTDNTAQTDTEVYTSADVTVSKACPGTAVAGEEVACTVTVTNLGPSLARNVDVKDVLPSGLTWVGGVASQGACAGGICQFGDVGVGAVVSAVVTASVGSDVLGDVTNQVQVFSDTPDPNSSNNSASATVTVQGLADLTIQKTAVPDPAVPGDGLSYEILVMNSGPSDAQNVTVDDNVPASFTLAGVSSSQGGCTALPCTLGTIPAGGSARVTLLGIVSSQASGTLTNTATVTATTTDPNTGNNETTITTTLNPQADLALDLTSTPTTYAGETAVVTATVTNNGPSVAAGATVTLTLPTGATFNSASLPTGWSVVDNGNGTVTLSTGSTIEVGTAIVLPVTVDIDDTVAPGTSLEFSGVLASLTADPTPSNNVDTADTNILGEAELRVDKRTVSGTVIAGQIVTYTIIVENLGPSLAQQVQVADSLPPQVLLVDSVASQGACAGTLCFLGDLAAGSTATVTVRVRVRSDIADGETISNAAIVSSITPDPGLYPNYDLVSNPAQALARLILSKEDMADPVSPGDTLIYHLALTNDGPGDAVNVLITDTLPAQVTYQASTDSCTETTPGVLTCDLGTVPAGQTVDFLVTTLVDTNVISGTVLNNTAAVTTTTPLTNSTLSATETTRVEQALGVPADLQIGKQAHSNVVTAGDLVTYTLVITNAGPGTALDVQVVDALPAGMTAVSMSASQGLCANGVCQLGVMPFNGSPTTATVQIVGLTASHLVSGTQLVNTAFVQSNQPDPVPDNNLASAPITLTAQVDLAVKKVDNPDPVAAGRVLTYTVIVTNTGPSDAVNVVVTDALPVGITFLNGTGCTESGGVVTCAVGSLTAGTSTSFVLISSVSADITGTLTNTVHVNSDIPDADTTNNTYTEPTSVYQLADLRLHKQASGVTVIAGHLMTYTLTVDNLGPSLAPDVIVTDTLSDDVTFVTATPTPDAGTSPPVWHLGDMPSGASQSITLVVRTSETVTPSALILNAARVTGAAQDPNPTNNRDSATVQAFTKADISVSKHVSGSIAYVGSSLIYTITVHNNGPSDALDVDVKDLVPYGMSLVSLESSQGACTGGICQLGNVPVSATAVITGVVEVANSVPEGSVLCNKAYVFHDTPDPDMTNNRSTVCVTAHRLSDLSISKAAATTDVTVGDLVTYTVVVTNSGPSPAQGVVVTDSLPMSSTYQTDTGSCVLVSAGLLRCYLGSIDVNDTMAFDVVVQVNNDADDPFLNMVSVTGLGDPDPTPGNNVDVAGVAVHRPNVRAVKSVQLWNDADHNGQGSPGDILRYTVLVTNTGSGTAYDVLYDDTPDVKTALVNGSVTSTQGTVVRGNTSGDTQVQVSFGDMLPGDVVTVTYDVTILPISAPPPVTLLNQGVVHGANFVDVHTDDPTTSASEDPTAFIVDITVTPTPTPTPCYRRISGRVFQDTNYNGVQDSGEPGMAGIVVTLEGPVNAQVTTRDNGEYMFTGLLPGDYTLSVTPPPGWMTTSPHPLQVHVSTQRCYEIPNQNVGIAPEATPTPTFTPTPTPTPTPTFTPTPTATPSVGCVEGHKIDDLHVGLPGWEIHAKPSGADTPNLVAFTDGTGYFRFDNLTPGTWTFWEVMQPGWEPVTLERFEAPVSPGSECTYIRFKNRQATPTPTATPTLPATPTPRPNPVWLPVLINPLPMCELAHVRTEIGGQTYRFPLKPDGNIKFVPPLPWNKPTLFQVIGYEGPIVWTQYKPVYVKQEGDYEFVYPGGEPGADFRLFVRTTCGVIVIDSSLKGPTPTPTSPAGGAAGGQPYHLFLPAVRR